MKNQHYEKDFVQIDKKTEKQEDAKLTFYLVTRSLLYVLIFFFAFFFCWYIFFISTHTFFVVSGQSMAPTLNASGSDTDAVYVDRLTPAKLNDIVVIETSSKDIIKRVVAVEGDYVSIYMDGDNFYLHRISSGTDIEGLTGADTLVNETSGDSGYTINDSYCWGNHSSAVLHDGVTYEPRFFSTYLLDYANGSTTTYSFVELDGAIYVQVPEDCVFYLGDNRSNSQDGRDNGFASLENVVGRVEIVVYDYNFGNRLGSVVNFYFEEIEKFFKR